MVVNASDDVLHIPANASEIPQHWHWRRLDTICEGIFDCPHSSPKLTEEGPYVVRSQDIRSGVFRIEEAGRVSEKTYLKRIQRAEPSHGDLLYSREGTYFGIAAEVPPNIKVCLGQRMVLIRPNPSEIHFRFLKYWLNSPVLAGHIYGHRDGTVAERLNLPTIRGLPVPVAPIAEQKEIAHILGTFDDKIELNQQMNRTLEGIARALFKSWFIDFDPVRAKLDGRQPDRMNAETAALFPDAFEDGGAIGPIPKGWKVEPVSEFIEIMNGGTPKTSIPEYWGGDIPWYAVTDAPNPHDVFVIDTARKITQAGLDNSATRILPVGTTIISARGTVGKCALTAFLIAMNQTCYGIKGQDGKGDFWTYFVIRNAIANLQQSSHGTVFDAISRATFKQIKFVVPTNDVIERFERKAEILLKKALNNLLEAQALATTRDALLPKLLSGEIRVKAAEQAVGAVA